MKCILKSAALAAFAIASGADATPTQAQQAVAAPQPYVTYQRPYTYTYAQPAPIPYARPRDSRAVLPAFSQRGGIGTTPFLGNTRGLGGFSTNYDAPPRSSSTSPSRPRRWGLFRRYP